MKDAQLLERLHRADAHASETALPGVIWPADLALREIERRTKMSDKTTDTSRPAAETPGGRLPPTTGLRDVDPNRRRWLLGLAAAAVVLVVGLLATLLPSGGTPTTTVPPVTTEATTTTAAPTTTVAPATTTTITTEAPSIDPIGAEALAQRFFVDFNSGDLDAAFTVFDEDATFGFRFPGFAEPETFTRNLQYEIFAWNVGQGTEYEAPSCSVETEGDPIVLLCVAIIYDARGRASDLGGVPVDVRITIGEAGVIDYLETYTGQDFNAASGRFGIWMEQEHPDVLADIDFLAWSGREEARADGEEMVTYAALWQEYLVANDCDPRICPLP